MVYPQRSLKCNSPPILPADTPADTTDSPWVTITVREWGKPLTAEVEALDVNVENLNSRVAKVHDTCLCLAATRNSDRQMSDVPFLHTYSRTMEL